MHSVPPTTSHSIHLDDISLTEAGKKDDLVAPESRVNVANNDSLLLKVFSAPLGSSPKNEVYD
jgi:hypothetical protein